MSAQEITVQKGMPEHLHTSAAKLYDEAFGRKLSIAVPSEEKRLALLEACLMPDFGFAAIAGDELVGIAGIHTEEGSLTGGLLSGERAYRYLVGSLGYLQGTWAALMFSMYDRPLIPGTLLMDGIAVHSTYRGQGIGTLLLDAVADYARETGHARVMLAVIDSNPRARQLYERKGYRAVKTFSFPYLRRLLGFGGYTTMIRRDENIALTVTQRDKLRRSDVTISDI